MKKMNKIIGRPSAFSINLKAPGFSAEALIESVAQIVTRTELWSMATISSTNESHISTAYFSFGRSFDFFFVSDRASAHVQNLTHSPQVAVTIFDSHQPWDSYHSGLQLFGKSWLASPAEVEVAQQIYNARFPDYQKYIQSLTASQRKASPYRFYVFRPETIKILDENRFGEEVFVLAEVERT